MVDILKKKTSVSWRVQTVSEDNRCKVYHRSISFSQDQSLRLLNEGKPRIKSPKWGAVHFAMCWELFLSQKNSPHSFTRYANGFIFTAAGRGTIFPSFISMWWAQKLFKRQTIFPAEVHKLYMSHSCIKIHSFAAWIHTTASTIQILK